MKERKSYHRWLRARKMIPKFCWDLKIDKQTQFRLTRQAKVKDWSSAKIPNPEKDALLFARNLPLLRLDKFLAASIDFFLYGISAIIKAGKYENEMGA